MAAYHGQGKLIDLLIQSGAVVDATDYLGLTPLHLACQRGFQNVMVYKHAAKDYVCDYTRHFTHQMFEQSIRI